MGEKTSRSIKKTLSFEKSGEVFSIEVTLENISPELKCDTVLAFLDTLFECIKSDINSGKWLRG